MSCANIRKASKARRDDAPCPETGATLPNSDFLHGVQEISGFLGTKPRRCYYLLEQRLIPARKLGNVWVARKSRLLAAQEAAEDATLTSVEEGA